MMKPGRPERWSRSKLTKGIQGYLQSVKGLERRNPMRDLRQCSPQPHPTLQSFPLFRTKKPPKAHFCLRPGAIRSADELHTVIEASGRLVIPRTYYDRAVQRYDGTSAIYRQFKLKETEEVTRQLAALSERLFTPQSHNVKAKSRLFPIRSLTPQPLSQNSLQNRLNTVLNLIDSAQKIHFRPRTPTFPA